MSTLEREPYNRPSKSPRPSIGSKYLLTGWLAGLAMMAAASFISYRLGALQPGASPRALPANQLNQQTSASKQPVDHVSESEQPALALPNGIVR
jgi:hypothetical protein